MQKVLVITYYWPPGSGAGVQRWLKFTKYLPGFGWEPFILTIDPSFAAYPATDKTLGNEIPSSLNIFRTKATDYFRYYSKDKSQIPSSGFASNDDSTLKASIIRFIRGNFFIPDPRKGWNKFAFREACRIIEKYKIDHIITSSPPHSTQLIGLKLKKRYPAIRWIADLRDPWTDIYYYDRFYPTWLAKKTDSHYELEVLKSADRIITVGQSLKETFSSKANGIADKTYVISNGYDDDDFKNINSSAPDIFTISYIGTLSDSYPVAGLLKALSGMIKSGKDLRLKFVGFISENQKRLISSVISEKNLEFIGYVDHRSAIQYMSGSSLLLLIIPEHPSSNSIITGKLFEYIATGKPVLCLGPEKGDAAGYLRSSGQTGIFDWHDSQSIEQFLSAVSNQHGPSSCFKIEDFSRKELTRKLVETLNCL